MSEYICSLIKKIKTLVSEKGQGMVEYALIIAFVAAIAALALNSNDGLGDKIKSAFTSAGDQIGSQVDKAGGSTSTTTNP